MAAGPHQKSTGRQSTSKGHPMHNPELLAGQDALTPIEHEHKHVEQQSVQASSTALRHIKKRDEKANSKQVKRTGHLGPTHGKSEEEGGPQAQGRSADSLAQLAKAKLDAKNQVQKQQQNQ